MNGGTYCGYGRGGIPIMDSLVLLDARGPWISLVWADSPSTLLFADEVKYQ